MRKAGLERTFQWKVLHVCGQMLISSNLTFSLITTLNFFHPYLVARQTHRVILTSWHMLVPGAGVDKSLPVIQILSIFSFCKYNFIGTQTYPFVHFHLQLRSCFRQRTESLSWQLSSHRVHTTSYRPKMPLTSCIEKHKQTPVTHSWTRLKLP